MRQLAEIAKISNPYLSQVERGLYKPSADVLKSIANALHLSAETMYSEAGLLDNSGSRDESHRACDKSRPQAERRPKGKPDSDLPEFYWRQLTDAARAWYT
jgi:transcriptional regulator with XRE-family HTH domain